MCESARASTQHERHTATPLPVGDRSEYYVSKRRERSRSAARFFGAGAPVSRHTNTRWESFDDCSAMIRTRGTTHFYDGRAVVVRLVDKTPLRVTL